MLGLEENTKKTYDYQYSKHNSREKNKDGEKSRQEAVNHGNRPGEDFDVVYTDLPKPCLAYLTRKKPRLLNVECILQETAQVGPGVVADRPNQKSSFAKQDLQSSTSCKDNKIRWENASNFSTKRNYNKEPSLPNYCSSYKSFDVMDLTEDPSENLRLVKSCTVKNSQSFTGQSSGQCVGLEAEKHFQSSSDYYTGRNSEQYVESETKKEIKCENTSLHSICKKSTSSGGTDLQMKVPILTRPGSARGTGTVLSTVASEQNRHGQFQNAKLPVKYSATMRCVGSKCDSGEFQQTNARDCLGPQMGVTSSNTRIPSTTRGSSLMQTSNSRELGSLMSSSKPRNSHLGPAGQEKGRFNAYASERKGQEHKSTDLQDIFQTPKDGKPRGFNFSKSTIPAPKNVNSKYMFPQEKLKLEGKQQVVKERTGSFSGVKNDTALCNERQSAQSISSKPNNGNKAKLWQKECKPATCSRNLHSTNVGRNSFSGSPGTSCGKTSQNAPRTEEQLQCCPMCQCRFPPG